MTTLTAGPELDREIAEALGWKWISYRSACSCHEPENERRFNQFMHPDKLPGRWWVERGKENPFDPDESGRGEQIEVSVPQYSTNLNHAFEAAELVGLWDDHKFTVQDNEAIIANKWDGEIIARSDTHAPALAICAAILEVGKK